MEPDQPTDNENRLSHLALLQLQYPHPTRYKRLPTYYPFHISHEKLWQKVKRRQKQLREPLRGLKERQEYLMYESCKRNQPHFNRGYSAVVCKDNEIEEFGPLCQVIRLLEKEQTGKFYYMVHAYPKSSLLYTPYNLKIAKYKNIHKQTYFTISKNGVLYNDGKECTFTPLEDWKRDYIIYCLIMTYKTFINFRKWKAFYIWRRNIALENMDKRTKSLEGILLFLNPALNNGVQHFKAMCNKLCECSFIVKDYEHSWQFFYFIEQQMGKYEDSVASLREFRSVGKELLSNACHGGLLEHGFTFDDSNFYAQFIGKRRRKIEGDPKMSHYEQARKKKFCIRLSKYLNLMDQMCIRVLHSMMVNSVTELLEMFELHCQFLPPLELLEETDISMVFEQPRDEEFPQVPLITITLRITEDRIYLDPNEKVMEQITRQIMELWYNSVTNFKPFALDPIFDPILRVLINGQLEERIITATPSMVYHLSVDTSIENKQNKLIDIIKKCFETADLYIQRFQYIYEFHAEDLQKTNQQIREEKDLGNWVAMIERYLFEEEEVLKIVDGQALGLFYVDLKEFKDTVLSLTRSLYAHVKYCLPILGKQNTENVKIEALEMREYLKTKPVTTDDYVQFISFLDALHVKSKGMETQLLYLRVLFEIMDDYNLPTNSDDIECFVRAGDLVDEICGEANAVFQNRPKYISEFTHLLSKDILVILDTVNKIRSECKADWVADETTDREIVTEFLSTSMDTLNSCVDQLNVFRDYQIQFKMTVIRVEMVTTTMVDVKLRILLWDTYISWHDALDEWANCDFSTLDPEDMNTFSQKCLKSIMQLEKGLPHNLMVAHLKDNINLLKDKLPTIANLRNPNLKARHWRRLENILDYKFIPDEIITLGQLESLNCLSFEDEILELSGQASSEASLELMLRKVEDVWKSLEFIVLPHRDAKDVYILGTLEEIQQALDDSIITINTIASSRNVGPIKPRVDEWLKVFDHFSKTLDEWQTCQKNWIYLEIIFSAPDIQRQLPKESKAFLIVDKFYKELMRNTAKMPIALEATSAAGLFSSLLRNNALLDQILKCLEAYLETKRVAFPRFYFLSNEELLDVLAQTRNPHAVQPHLRKCFDAISRLEFGVRMDSQADIFTSDIVGMISPEGEKVYLTKGLKARGNVEDWLKKVEESMFISLKKEMKKSIIDYETMKRDDWLQEFPSQIILIVAQIMWAQDVHAILDKKRLPKTPVAKNLQELKLFERKCFNDLNHLAGIVRTDISSIFRKVLIALITISVHSRDTLTSMVKHEVYKSTDFEWLKMLRYYWDYHEDYCTAKMSSAIYTYGYEYLGAAGVLVITPLTDKCYLCLMGALQLKLGGAPAGPAGTGKTETTKDLAKAVAVQCVVFNCSEGLDYKMMGRFFSGLAQSGAWCCFDEFNRIDIEVLSVIAQQLITIRNAKVINAKRFMFEGREIKLVQTCAAFITMNPGYAGRTELPDNLKALFRPISMMVPDYGLIAEVTLYSEGFESSSLLAQKMVQMYKLCSEQLSQQDHYDFGMRAVKSVLVMAGALKRSSPDISENLVLIRALRDSNLPKFLADDAQLFQGILGDLFPGVVLPEQDYGILQEAIEFIVIDSGLQIVDKQITKVIQLFETMIVRWGVMLVGPTGGGKSTTLDVLKKSLTKLCADEVPGQYYRTVITYILNPKAVTLGELYGEVNPYSMEWRDGLLGVMVRAAVQSTNEDHQWVICDGPVDAVWIENMNTVLDDNKMLCLANSERIKLTPYVHMIFEVQDLAQASPATVSRCGMVYIDPEEIKWKPFVKSWLQNLTERVPAFPPSLCDLVFDLFSSKVEDGFIFIRQNTEVGIHQVDIAKVNMMCNLFESIINQKGALDREESIIRTFSIQTFIFSYLWSIGGNILDAYRMRFEQYIKEQFEYMREAQMPRDCLWDMYIDIKEKKFGYWADIIPQFQYNPELPFFETIVPTTDTVKFGYLMERLIVINKPVLFSGETGVGKSVMAKVVLSNLLNTGIYVPIVINFSAQTSSARTQEILELRLEKLRKNLLGAPFGKKVVIFVDDVNMPKLDTYGTQPPIELLRQYLDYGGLYDKEKLFWKRIVDVTIIAACAPPGGGRNPLTPRFVRHFGMLLIPPLNENLLKSIFRAIMQGFLSEFTDVLQRMSEAIVTAAVNIYNRIATDLLPTPSKSHYIFNLRDLSKCVQGILQATPNIVVEKTQMLRLFYHECLRVFHDRLISVEDRSYFYRLMKDVCTVNFSTPVLELPEDEIITNPPVLLFGDFAVFGAPKENKFYQELVDIDKLKLTLQEHLDDFNITYSKNMKIIFFLDALEHITRIARILRAERGNCLLVGVGGMGKQSLTKLASHVNEYKCWEIELSRNYDHSSFFEDLRRFYFAAGGENENTVFLFTDNQIIDEEFLEDVNNILNSGDVPNLFESDELEKVITACRPAAKDFGISEANRDGIYEFFINRVRSNLHLSLCMSPISDTFRRRCRMFPSLVNCCSIDWYMKWPEEALISVAEDSLQSLNKTGLVPSLAALCFVMHESVEQATVRYYDEMKRYYYTTPSSYLDLLKLYHTMRSKKMDEITKNRSRIANGLTKLYETNDMIRDMKITLVELGPQLAAKSVAVELLMKNLVTEQASADKVKEIVKKDEESAFEKAAESKALAEDAQKDLDEALPAMEAASKALDSLNKNDINELRVFVKPPQLVQFVMEAVCLLLGTKKDWASAKNLLGDTNFLKRLKEYNKDAVTNSLLKKLAVYVDNKKFMPDIVAATSKVCKSMCMWVRAVNSYVRTSRIVEPKKERQRLAEIELNQVMKILREKQKKLADVEAHIAHLQKTFDDSVQEKQDLVDSLALTAARLLRSGRLTMALADEQVRWEVGVKVFDEQVKNALGDVLIAAASVAYLGAFTSNYREQLVQLWTEKFNEYEVSISQPFSLTNVLATPYQIRFWNNCGLPRDNVSTENGILVVQAGRWPLMIDPQEQANRWIRQMEGDNLSIIKFSDHSFLKSLEGAIRTGIPVLLEEVGETLDPTLNPILLKQTFFSAGRLLIRLGDTDIDYDQNFRLYITTKLSNPHYLPEICIRVTLINFTVTPSGLEDQLLADVVRLERPDLEEQRNELIVRINADKATLSNIEDKILRLLFASEGNILDDEDLIETLNESKETSGVIESRLIETEATEKNISIARERYRCVAIRGAVLYFVVARLADIDPMYQYSLKYFKQIFNNVIETSEKNADLNIRLEILFEQITLAVYTQISRGLFERHKLVFSFMVCVDILRERGDITDVEWSYLLRGAIGTQTNLPKKPDVASVTDAMWTSTNYLANTFPVFKSLPKDILNSIPIKVGNYEIEIKVALDAETVIPTWNINLNDFQKLMILKCLKEEKLVFAITEYVKAKLGVAFIESPQVSLHNLYNDTTHLIPLIFVLSSGTDPFGAFQKFAIDMGKLEKIQSISLGQGQGPVAEKMISIGKARGDWIFLQNCHLATSWMLAMERIIQKLPYEQFLNPEFRLFLSSMPSTSFPVSVLQNSVKVTNEPPKGLKANIKRALTEMPEDYFERHHLEQDWRTMVFGVSVFHAIIQERKKFGPLGWNITYEFNDNDRECAFNTMQMFCNEKQIPWEALDYIIGEITYGGRVTDFWDLRCLKTILKNFFAPITLDASYRYSKSGTYYCPHYPLLSNYKDFIDTFPIIEDPEIFGMHENANIAFQINETKTIILTILESQPRTSSIKGAKSSDEIVYELSDMIIEVIKPKIIMEKAYKLLFQHDTKGRLPSLTTVLTQEIDRFNRLLNLVHSSIRNIQKAIKGLVVMSEILEEVFVAFLNNQVPRLWSAKAYPSLKNLGGWVHDLQLRIDFIWMWGRFGPPPSFWLSGFFFPQGFLTGILQTHARKYDLPIDALKFDFDTTPVLLNQEDIKLYHDEFEKENHDLYGGLKSLKDGVNMHGLFLDAAKWNYKTMLLDDQLPGEMNPPFPAMMLTPTTVLSQNKSIYICPLYKTSVRAGTLSTTGHSTNFVVTVMLRTDLPQSYWILKGAALLCQTNE